MYAWHSIPLSVHPFLFASCTFAKRRFVFASFLAFLCGCCDDMCLNALAMSGCKVFACNRKRVCIFFFSAGAGSRTMQKYERRSANNTAKNGHAISPSNHHTASVTSTWDHA